MSAEVYFSKLWAEMPDHTSAPTETEKGIAFYRGDMCKVNGRLKIWSGAGWWDYIEHQNEKILVEERLNASSPVVIWMASGT